MDIEKSSQPKLFNMDLSTLKAMISFNQWFWFSISGTAFSFLGTSAFALLNQKTHDPFEKGILCGAFYIFNALDIILFVLNLRNGAIFENGFYCSILLPTVLFYTTLISLIVTIVKIAKNGLMSKAGQKLAKIYVFSLLLLKITFSLAYTSPSGFLISALSLVVYIILLLIWPKHVEEAECEEKHVKTD